MRLQQRRRDVITDACVLINLAILGRLDVLGQIPDLRFLIPEDVIEEVLRPEQRAQLIDALGSTALTRVRVSGIEALIAYTEVRAALGAGDAACVAYAATRGCLVASDDKRVQREVRRRCGENRLISTAGLMQLAIRYDLLSPEEVGDARSTLAKHHFHLSS